MGAVEKRVSFKQKCLGIPNLNRRHLAHKRLGVGGDLEESTMKGLRLGCHQGASWERKVTETGWCLSICTPKSKILYPSGFEKG